MQGPFGPNKTNLPTYLGGASQWEQTPYPGRSRNPALLAKGRASYHTRAALQPQRTHARARRRRRYRIDDRTPPYSPGPATPPAALRERLPPTTSSPSWTAGFTFNTRGYAAYQSARAHSHRLGHSIRHARRRLLSLSRLKGPAGGLIASRGRHVRVVLARPAGGRRALVEAVESHLCDDGVGRALRPHRRHTPRPCRPPQHPPLAPPPRAMQKKSKASTDRMVRWSQELVSDTSALCETVK